MDEALEIELGPYVVWSMWAENQPTGGLVVKDRIAHAQIGRY